jgi:hypothetical protein
MATRSRKPAPTPVKKTRAKKTIVKKTVAKKTVAKKTAVKKPRIPAVFRVDLSAFPPESVSASHRWLCVACVWQIFTRAMQLAPKIALAEMKRYTPTFEELTSAEAVRPFFTASERAVQEKEPCPYCGSPAKWHARIATHRIESGKATDALRRSLVKALPKSDDQFVVLEQKATQQHAFFEWLEKISANLDLEQPVWLRDVSLHYLSRKEPKVNWQAAFVGVHSIRRSRRLEAEQAAWEVENGRMFLAPMLFDELLLVQYVVSRSQLAGGLTLEHRYTLPELWRRLRHSGYLRFIGVEAGNPSDALEQMLAHLSGGEASARYYYIVDRRELLQRVKLLQSEKPRVHAAKRA